MYRLAYFGREQSDIVFYLMKAAFVLNRKVVVVDNSISGDLYRSLADERSMVADKGSVVILRNKDIQERHINEFDHSLFIYYAGLQHVVTDIGFERLYIDVTQSAIVIEDTRRALEDFDLEDQAKNITFILDRITKRKLTIGACKEELGMLEIPTNDIELPLDEVREQKYEIFTQSGDCKLKGNSKDFIEFINEEAMTLFSLDKKSFKKLLNGKY